jgi:hypothetical protein
MEKWRMGVFEQPAETWVGKRERGKERKKAREREYSVVGLGQVMGGCFLRLS